MRKSVIALGIVGVVFLAAAALLAFWVTPQFIARLPGDSNTTRIYDGQIQSLVNPVALQQGNFAAAIKLGLPQTVRRQVQVLQTSGNTALVQDSSTVESSGQPVGSLTSKYAIDRRSLEATGSHPSDWVVTDAQGLTVNWPIGANQHDYTGWVPFTQTTTPLKYLRKEQHGGVETYVYQANVPATRIKNQQVLATLPKALPVNLAQAAGKAGLIPASLLTQLAGIFPASAQIPLAYTYAGTSTYWVAPATGVVVDIATSEKQTAGVAIPGGKIIPVLPVLADSYHGSQASVQAAATDANNGSDTIQLLGTTIPIVLAVIGLVLVVVAVVLAVRGRRHSGQGGLPHAATSGTAPPTP